MKISILTPDVSSNCLGRAYLLAKVLQTHYNVEIIGPMFGDTAWKAVGSDKSITCKFCKIRGKFRPYWQIKQLVNNIDCDVLYASKPLYSSFGLGLYGKALHGIPLVLDIDDWQMGFIKESCNDLSLPLRLRYITASSLFFYSTYSYWNILIGEKLCRRADDITVSNSFLQRKFGGTIVWHARDTNALNPSKVNGHMMRKKHDVAKDSKVVMFLGTLKPYKGIEDLINAVGLINNTDVMLFVVGIGESTYGQKMAKYAKRILNRRFRGIGQQPFQKVPEFLSMADVVVIPQRRGLATIGQVPAKVFDAMAMGRPIIATNVCDLPQILDGCGWMVEPNNPKELAKAIEYVLEHTKEATEVGWKARIKCTEKYGFHAMEEVLVPIFEKYA